MDLFEDFEMKPLSDGLGFHKKAVRIKKQMKDSLREETTGKSEIPMVTPSSIPENSNVRITENLPREGWGRSAASTDVVITPSKMPPFIPESERQNDFGGGLMNVEEIPLISPRMRRGAADSPRGGLIESTMSAPSFVIDLFAITAITLLFLAALLVITQVSLNDLFVRVSVYPEMQVYMGTLLATVSFLYIVSMRSVFGRTLGEWTFEYQIGKDDQMADPAYPLRVVGRTLLVFVTGLFVLPILSLITRRDLTGKITGIPLYQKK